MRRRGAGGAAAQRGTLLDSEAMLLVDHGQAEPLELDLVLDQGVRADDERGAAVANRGERLAALAGAGGAGEQDGADVAPLHVRQIGEPEAEHVAPGVEQAGDRAEVLLREHLRWRHQRGLAAAVRAGQHRRQGDHRLARADVALEQAGHRRRARDLALDLGERATLCRGERKGQGLEEAAHRVRLGDRRRKARLCEPALAPHDGELHCEQFIEGEPALGTARHRVVRGVVDLAEGLAPPDQLVACAQLVGQRLVDCLGVALERLLDVAPEHGLGESPGAAVDGHEAAAVLLAGVEQVELRVRHRDLAAAVVEADLADEGDSGARRQARGEPGLVEPGDGQHVAERVAYLRLAGAVHAAAPALGADGHHHAADGSLLADLELADAACGREVVVAERVVAEQVVGGRDPERLVASELVVADPESGVLERCLCGRRGRCLCPRFRPRAGGRWLRGCRRLCWRWCACGRSRGGAAQTCDLSVQPRGSRGRREVAVACRREPPGKLLHVSALPRVPFEEGVEAADDRAIMAAPPRARGRGSAPTALP